MDARAESRPVSAELDRRDPVARLERGLDGAAGFGEGRHQAVAEPLGDRAAVQHDRRIDRVGDLAQQLERGLVAGLERPAGEIAQVGEQDRHVHLPPAPALGLGQRLPHLEGPAAGLAEDAPRAGAELGELADGDGRWGGRGRSSRRSPARSSPGSSSRARRAASISLGFWFSRRADATACLRPLALSCQGASPAAAAGSNRGARI